MSDSRMDLKLYFEVQEMLRPPLCGSGAGGELSKSGSLFCPPQPLLPKDHYNEVYPKIILGNHSITKDFDKLKSLGVTHLVNASMGPRFNQTNTSREFYRGCNIEFHGIPAMDTATFKLCPYFGDAANFIDDAINNDSGTVYVHCQQGMSRSATIVLAFLMLKRDMDLMTATKLVRSKREIFPNDGFLKQLCQLQERIKNENTVTTG